MPWKLCYSELCTGVSGRLLAGRDEDGTVSKSNYRRVNYNHSSSQNDQTNTVAVLKLFQRSEVR